MPGPERITIRRIAGELNLSSSTVSRALAGRPEISPETTRRVIETARRLGYRPPPEQRTVVLILPDTDLPLGSYSIGILNGMRRECSLRGLRLESVAADHPAPLEERSLYGAISFDFRQQLAFEWGRAHQLPLVCVNDMPRHLNGVYSVFTDEVQAMAEAVNHLAGFGHRRIGLLLSGAPTHTSRNRRQGFEQVMRAHGFPLEGLIVDDALFPPPPARVDGPGGMLRKLLDAGATAIIASGEGSAAEVYFTLLRVGGPPPEKLSLIVWEQEEFCRFAIPPLTAIRQNFNLLASKAVDLLEAIAAGEVPDGDIPIPAQLILRGSVSTPPPEMMH